jgi:V/A-type H+-transporting ATPase subunit I
MNPAQRIKEIEEEIARTQTEIEKTAGKIRSYADRREEIRFVSDYFAIRAEKYGVISQLLQSRRVFFLEGFVPAAQAQDLASRLERRFDVAVEIKNPGKKEKPPILLKNNGFASPLEGVTESYSLPGKKEIDPTFLSSLFYYILFGIMLSDAGYGILLFVATGVILVKFGGKMEEGMKKTMRMFFFCGIATTFWGFMFGSFFGDAVSVIGQTFFGKGTDFGLKPLWFAPLDEPMRMLTFCFIIALIHMFVGLGAKAYMLIKEKKIMDMVYDVVLWYVLLISCIVFLLTVPTMAEMLSVSSLPAPLKTPMMVLMVISAVGIILTGGRESKNWVKRILKGLYALYGISGWLSDILSYSRLLALGLATGVIAQVFNSMGSMGGSSIPGAVMFIVVFLIGNVLNLAINALGAYVHTNRLTYVEFFGKFYEGGGKKFRPFAANTKYYKFKEDM